MTFFPFHDLDPLRGGRYKRPFGWGILAPVNSTLKPSGFAMQASINYPGTIYAVACSSGTATPTAAALRTAATGGTALSNQIAIHAVTVGAQAIDTWSYGALLPGTAIVVFYTAEQTTPVSDLGVSVFNLTTTPYQSS